MNALYLMHDVSFYT